MGNKILLTGANGLLGGYVLRVAKNHNVIATDYNELDITNYGKVESYIKKAKPKWIINCAAYTNVDLAESEKDSAELINIQGAKNLAQASKKFNLKLIHISTDMVFTGTKSKYEFTENSAPNPVNYYGKTKLQGELEVLKHSKNSYVLRTQWLYGGIENKLGFVNKVIQWSESNNTLKIVTDEIGSPTYAKDLALSIIGIINNPTNYIPGIYHVTNQQSCSRYILAKEIAKILNLKVEIKKASIKDFKRPAKVSYKCVIKNTKFIKQRNYKLALLDYLSEYSQKG